MGCRSSLAQAGTTLVLRFGNSKAKIVQEAPVDCYYNYSPPFS